MFPSYLLNKVYVPHSLKNIAGGYEFVLKNVIDSGTLSGVKALTVDGVDVPLTAITLKTPSLERKADEITYRAMLPLHFNSEAVVRVAGDPLAAGQHRLVLALNVVEAGRVDLQFEDEVA